MFVACWSAKGGSGTTVVAAALAVTLARREPTGALLVDLDGDCPAVLGLAETSGPGVAEWLGAGAAVPPDGLARIEVPVAPRLGLLPAGGALPDVPGRGEALVEALAADRRAVVVDCGSHPDGAARAVAAMAPVSLLVLRPCYLALRRAARSPLRPSGVVVVDESHRSLGAADIEAMLGVPVRAVVPVEGAIARAVDAGLLGARVPGGLARALHRAA